MWSNVYLFLLQHNITSIKQRPNVKSLGKKCYALKELESDLSLLGSNYLATLCLVLNTVNTVLALPYFQIYEKARFWIFLLFPTFTFSNVLTDAMEFQITDVDCTSKNRTIIWIWSYCNNNSTVASETKLSIKFLLVSHVNNL